MSRLTLVHDGTPTAIQPFKDAIKDLEMTKRALLEARDVIQSIRIGACDHDTARKIDRAIKLLATTRGAA